ncbi:hypothetical protein [Actinoplanes sp. NBRC 101535]|uniref:hypothetical protein n=1 Tax=Actinoplanes sp. NBRC 101535 TaxID=3032196 RepID=UPI002556A745|nr:hypothetical protein [Actinoplanes sp. NBRC 101535]
MIDWDSIRDARGDSGVVVDRLRLQPDAALWDELDRRLVVEDECFFAVGFAALPALSQLAQAGDTEQWDRALDLAAVITRTLHRNHEDDRLVRAIPDALAVLHRLARARVATCVGPTLVRRLQDALAFAGYTFWASISLDFTDEHYHLGCPHCSTRLAIVIGDYGHYSAIRDYNDGDVHRVPLRPAAPADLAGVGRWMHETASASGDTALADGLTYLFGDVECGACGCTFNLADWFEAENSPAQPIDPVVPRTDCSA